MGRVFANSPGGLASIPGHVIPKTLKDDTWYLSNTIKGAGEKRTNEQYAWVNSSAEGELCNIAFPLCICRLTLAWISSEFSTKLLGMPTHLDRSSFTGLDSLSCQLFTSTVRCRLATRVTPSPTASTEFLWPTPLTGFPFLIPGHVEISGPNPFLVSRLNRQRDHLLGGPPT